MALITPGLTPRQRARVADVLHRIGRVPLGQAAASPEAAGLLRASDVPPDVALLELLQRGTTGFTYADALLTRYPRIRLLFMAGGRDEEQPLMAAAHARGLVLHKPFTPPQLLDAMQAPLRKAPASSPTAIQPKGDHEFGWPNPPRAARYTAALTR